MQEIFTARFFRKSPTAVRERQEVRQERRVVLCCSGRLRHDHTPLCYRSHSRTGRMVLSASVISRQRDGRRQPRPWLPPPFFSGFAFFF